MTSRDTIFALSSGKGRSGIAVIRISGPETDRVLAKLMCREIRDLPSPQRASLAPIFLLDQTQKLDDALVIRFLKPKSFTGENVAELHLHGAPAVIAAAFKVFEEFSALRPAEPGEFTRRAFENGRMDLTEVEGLADLINAETEMQRRQAIRQMDGELGKLYEYWREILVRALAYLEATIDFSEAEISQEELGKIVKPAFALEQEINLYLADNRRGEVLREGVRVAIIGAPNAGKSTLLNNLATREVAIISEIAGTTRDVLEVQMDIAGYPMLFADTAGIRESEEAIEKEGIRRAIENADKADLRIIVLEVGNPQSWPPMIPFVTKDDIIVINKSDIIGTPPIKLKVENTIVKVSAKTGEGMHKLTEKLLVWADSRASGAMGEAPALTRARHRKELEHCVGHLREARAAWEAGAGDELIAEDTRLAARALGRITGRTDVENLLDVIFNDFCIGK